MSTLLSSTFSPCFKSSKHFFTSGLVSDSAVTFEEMTISQLELLLLQIDLLIVIMIIIIIIEIIDNYFHSTCDTKHLIIIE